VNEIYVFGQQTTAGRGGEVAAEIVGTVSGLRIPYYAVVDFNGFRQLVDDLGGVRVLVERAFTDHAFPTSDDGVRTVSFAAGWQWLSGEEALRFARSRHGGNGEGSDFARARRQQKVLLALKDRILSSRVLLNPITVNALVTRFQGSVTTNLEPWELVTLYRLSQRINTERIVRASLDTTPGGLLVEATGVDGAYLLQPRGGSYAAVQERAAQLFDDTPTSLEPTRVEVLNGTDVAGLAADVAAKLERTGFTVVGVRNAEQRPVADTVIYDLTNGGKPTSLAALRVMFDADVARRIPPWLLPSAETLDPRAAAFTGPTLQSAADFVIIIGTDHRGALTSSRPGADG
jgi:LCP family protein required for cell wall assembly